MVYVEPAKTTRLALQIAGRLDLLVIQKRGCLFHWGLDICSYIQLRKPGSLCEVLEDLRLVYLPLCIREDVTEEAVRRWLVSDCVENGPLQHRRSSLTCLNPLPSPTKPLGRAVDTVDGKLLGVSSSCGGSTIGGGSCGDKLSSFASS